MATTGKSSEPPTTTEDAAANAASSNERADDKLVVPVHEGEQHGYFGHRPRTEPNSSFTVQGVTGGTANVADSPKSAQRSTKS